MFCVVGGGAAATTSSNTCSGMTVRMNGSALFNTIRVLVGPLPNVVSAWK